MSIIKKIKPLFTIILSFAILISGFPNLIGSVSAAGRVSETTNSNSEATVKDLPVPSPAPSDIFRGSPVSKPEPTVTPGIENKRFIQQNNQSSEEVVSVTGVVYDDTLLTISKLKARTLQKKSRLQLGAVSQDSKESFSRSAENESMDLNSEDIELLFQAGASKVDLYWLNLLVMGQTKWTAMELLKSKQERDLSWGEIQKELENENGISDIKTVEDEVYGENLLEQRWRERSVVLSSVYGPEENQKKLSKQQLMTSSVSAFDSNVSDAFKRIVQAQINQLSKPQFDDRSTSSELVDPASGTVTRKQNLIRLPGVDGLDLDVGLKYNSNQGVPFIYHDYWNPYWEMYDRDIEYNLPTLASGWSFQFPSVQSVDGESYYHDGAGGVYKIGSNDELSNYTHLINYKGKEKRYVYAWGQANFTNGQENSTSYIEYSDQKREYFGSNGQLIGIVDRFGNTITFNYNNNTNTLLSITDTLKRVVKFSYEKATDSDPYSAEYVVIQVLNGEQQVQKVVLKKGKVLANIPNGDYVEPLHVYVPILSEISQQINDQEEEKTYFNYQDKLPLYSSYGYNYTSLLTEVNYTNSTTKYEYEGVNRNISYDSSVLEFRAKSRKDYTGAIPYQQVEYTYTGNYSGNTAAQYPGNLPDDFRYSTTSTVISNTPGNGLSTTNTFDKDGKVLRTETVAGNGERKIVENTVFHALFSQSPTRTTISEYAAQDSESTANRLYTETAYTDWGQVQSQTEPLTTEQWNNSNLKQHYTTSYQYEPVYRFTSSVSWYQNETDNTPYTESYTYTDKGRLASVTNALGEQTVYSYNYKDDKGGISQVTTEKLAQGEKVAKSVTFYDQNSSYAYPLEQQQWFNIGTAEEKTVKTTMGYDLGSGRLISQTDGNDQTTSYEYDDIGRLKKETLPEVTNTKGEKYSQVTDYDYYSMVSPNLDSVNAGVSTLKVDSIKTVTRTDTGSTQRTYANVLYNGLGLALLEERYDDSVGRWVFTQYHYDDLGHAVYVKDALGNETTASYDAWNRQTRSTDPYNNLYVTDFDLKQHKSTSYMLSGDTQEKLNYIETTYDQKGQVLLNRTYQDWPSQNIPVEERYAYNITGSLTSYTDPMNHRNNAGVTTSYRYDALNRLTSIQDALNQTTKYTYDGNGQLSNVTIQGQGGTPQTLNSKEYNEIGLLTVKQDGAALIESRSYNALGQLTGSTDRNGSTFGYTYDERGQLSSSTIKGRINNVDQTQTIEQIMGDTIPENQTINTYVNGTLEATQTLSLDSFGQVRSRYSLSGGHSSNVLNERDALGRMTQINDAYLGFYTNYQYNKTRLEKVQTNGNSGISNTASDNVEYSYNANGQVKSIIYPTLETWDILMTDYTYNKALGWVESVSNTKGEMELTKYIYSYDRNGNIVSITETRNYGGSNNFKEKKTYYDYDALNRLVTVSDIYGQKSSYTYDVRGNRLTLSNAASSLPASLNTNYTYDLQNTLASVGRGENTTKFKYYADGLRFLKSTGNAHTQVNYDFNGQVITEEKLDGDNIVQKSTFVRGDRVLVKKDNTASKDYYYLYNGHGDVVQIVDTNGRIVNNYEYDVWGNITSQREEIANSFKYAGEMYDAETGLYYLRARYYDPSIGRFLNEDTVEGQIDNPLTQNLYTYVHNNPLIYSDPSGHMTFEVTPGSYSSPEVIKRIDLESPSYWQGLKKRASGIRSKSKRLNLFGEVAKAIVEQEAKSVVADMVWSDLSATQRGEIIEEILAEYDYKNMYQIGSEYGGYFPVIDFVTNDRTIISLKTIDPRTYSESKLDSALSQYLKELNSLDIYIDKEYVKLQKRRLDIVVPKGTKDMIDLKSLLNKAGGTIILVKEF